MRLIDAHCHVDLYPDYEQVVQDINRDRIATIAVTNAPSVFQHSANLIGKQKYVRVALGLHPELVAQRSKEITTFIELSSTTRFIGEVGLDFVTTDAEERKLQQKVFAAILADCAFYKDKILTVHSRRAARDVVDMVGIGFTGSVILHWFSGSIPVLENALGKGCFFSVNPAMTKSEAGQRIIQAIPKNRLLTETDGPFSMVGQRASKPCDVGLVILYLASIWKLPEESVAKQVYANFQAILSEPT